MTTRIDAKALQDAIQEHSDERLQKDLREWLVYTAPFEVQEIWKKYVEKVEEAQIHAARQQVWATWSFFILVAIIVVTSMWDLLTLDHAIRGCLK